MAKDEREALMRCQSGDRGAYGEIVERYQVRVYDLVRFMVNDVATAEDITQEAFVRGFVKIHLFDTERRFLPWILKIATNLVRDYQRASARREIPQKPEVMVSVAGKDTALEAHVDHKNSFELIELALAQIPEKYRLSFLLKHSEELTYREMSEVLNEPATALKMRVSRARAMLREILHAHKPDQEGSENR